MRFRPKFTKKSRVALGCAVLLLGGLALVCWRGELAVFLGLRPFTTTAGVLVLEDNDDDFQKPPFEDAVTLFDTHGQAIRKLGDLNICQTVGGCRSLSVSGDGRFFTVCENVRHRLCAYEIETGRRLWSLDGDFASATVASNGLIYALNSDKSLNPLFGKLTQVIDQNGKIVQQTNVGGFDIVVDSARNSVWVAGQNIQKLDLQLNPVWEVKTTPWMGVSLDFDRDGAVWVAERQHPNARQSTNRIFKLSSSGEILNSIPLSFSPYCVRVERSDGSVWVTGRGMLESRSKPILEAVERRTGPLPTGKKLRDFLTKRRVLALTRRYDSNGAMLCEINHGGFSLDLEPGDGSIWIAGWEKIYHDTLQGTALGQYPGAGSSDQKCVAVIPVSAVPNSKP